MNQLYDKSHHEKSNVMDQKNENIRVVSKCNENSIIHNSSSISDTSNQTNKSVFDLEDAKPVFHERVSWELQGFDGKPHDHISEDYDELFDQSNEDSYSEK